MIWHGNQSPETLICHYGNIKRLMWLFTGTLSWKTCLTGVNAVFADVINQFDGIK